MVKRSDSDFKEGYKNANFDDSDKLYQQAELIIRSLNSLGNFQISSNFEG